MAEDPNKKSNKPPERFGAPRVEKTPDIAEIELESNTERVRAAMAERRTTVVNQSETFKTSLENRVAGLPEEIKGEATEIMTRAQEEINKNEAELLAEQEAAKEIENSWFAYGEKMDGGGPLEETRPTFLEEKVEVGQASSEQPVPKEQFVETEEDKQELEMAARIGILERVLKQRGLSPEKRLAYQKELDELEKEWETINGTTTESAPASATVETQPAVVSVPRRRQTTQAVSAPDVTPDQTTSPVTDVHSAVASDRQITNEPRQEPTVEIAKTREQLLTERRALQREWEKEATKLTEHKMSKEEKNKYQQLTGKQKMKMKPEERQKLISDVGFTTEDYNLMKAGTKPWTLNAIWKRLGELDREIASARPAESAPAVGSPTTETRRGNPARAVAGSFETRSAATPVAEDEITINEDAFKVQELADAARVLNGVLSKLDKNYADNNTAILEQINKNPAAVKTFVEQSSQTLKDWQNVTNARDIIPALAPDYGTKEDLNKLSTSDLEAIRQHTVDKLIESIRLAEHVPGTKKAKVEKEPSVKEKEKEKNEIKDAMMSEIQYAIENAEAWYRGNEEEELEAWSDASHDADFKELLKEKLWPVADDIKLLKSEDLKKIREQVIAKLTPIVNAVREAKPPEAPSVGFAEKAKEHHRKTLDKDIREAMEKRAELRQAVRRGEKGAENKLRTISSKLEKLRAEKREMKKEK